MSRLRLIAGIVCALLLLATVASWSRSFMAMDVVAYRFGTLRAPGGDREDPGMWTYVARSVEANHVLGNVRFMVTRYKSLGQSREDMRAWEERPTWDAASIPRSVLKSDGGWWRFRVDSWKDWNILGLGVASGSRQGVEAWTVSAPHWFLALLSGGAMWRLLGVPWLRWKRGRCPRCAYDLRQVVGDRCPECGWDRT